MKKIFISLVLFSAALAQAQTANYNFEAPTYIPGTLNGQPNWFNTTVTTGSTVVTTEMANPGTQSIKQTGNSTSTATTTSTGGVRSATFNTSQPTVTFMFNAYFLPSVPAGEESDFVVSAQSPDQASLVGRMFFTWDGKIQVVNYNAAMQLAIVDTGSTFTKNAWHTYKMEIDFTAQTIKYFQDGVQIYQGAPVAGTTKVGNVTVTNNNYSSSAYFDGITYFEGILQTTDVAKSNYSIFPNPTSDIINFSVKDKVKSAQIFDMGGRLIPIKFYGNSASVEHLAPGIYQFVAETEKGKMVDRFIKK